LKSIIIIFYLLTTPADKIICSLWVDQPPSANDVREACGPVDLDTLMMRAALIDGGSLVRDDLPASELYNILEHLPAIHDDTEYGLGDYRIEIYEPDHSEIYCVVKTREYQPTPYEFTAQCGLDAIDKWNNGEIYFQQGEIIEVETDPDPQCMTPELTPGAGMYQFPYGSASLATQEPYTWLAGQLIWWGYTQGDCGEGWSGIDVATLTATPCGVTGALDAVVDWQNQFDREIWGTAKEYQVPPKLLKGVIGIESQFWPLWNSREETSVAQITIDGLDIALRYDPNLAAKYCTKTLWDCTVGYPRLNLEQQEQVRQALYADLTCYHCGPEEARRQTQEIIPLFARIIRAYRCFAVELTGETEPNRAWEVAAAAYHAGGGCLQNGEICDRGIGYLAKIKVMMTEVRSEDM